MGQTKHLEIMQRCSDLNWFRSIPLYSNCIPLYLFGPFIKISITLLTLALVKWNSCFMIVKLYWTHSRQNHPLCCTLLCHLVPTLLSKARIKNVLFSDITKQAAVGFGAKSEKKSSNPIPRSYFNGFWCQITDCLRKYKRKLHCPPHILKYEDTHNQ